MNNEFQLWIGWTAAFWIHNRLCIFHLKRWEWTSSVFIVTFLIRFCLIWHLDFIFNKLRSKPFLFLNWLKEWISMFLGSNHLVAICWWSYNLWVLFICLLRRECSIVSRRLKSKWILFVDASKILLRVILLIKLLYKFFFTTFKLFLFTYSFIKIWILLV